MPSLRSLALPALAGLAFVPALAAQEASLDQIHPRRFVQFGWGIGDQDLETNTGSLITGVNSRSTDAFHFRLRGEYFFESEFGFFGNIYLGIADDINQDLGAASSSYDSFGVFVAASYRATMGENFRLPVRFGPFIQTSEEGGDGLADGEIERSMIGVRLSAEPEYVLWKQVEGGKVTELSAFAEFGCGAGPSEVEDDVDSEDGYAFTLGWEVGLRYRFTNGFVAGLSWFDQKNHFGTTETYNNTAFFGLDDDFTGIMLSAGYRF